VTPTPVVVPFRAGGKSRLPASIRAELALAMLGDVLDAASALGPVRLVTGDAAAGRVASDLGVQLVDDPGGGQGAAVQAALFGVDGPCLVVNADLPCVTPGTLEQLGAAAPAHVAALDGTTNALSLPGPTWFANLYGSGSAARFAAAGLVAVRIPELERDVDTLADLERLTGTAGPRTTLVVSHHKLGLARVP
jgi:2-phospho-L-lactate guanylyltransferase (CobY/MobA/RfbA family)